MVDRERLNSKVHGRPAPATVAPSVRRAKAPISREFRDTQSLTLPLDRECGPEDPHVRMMRLREAAVRGTFEQRTNFLLNEVCVRTPDVQHVLTITDQLLDVATYYANPGGMVVIGDAGMGKDALIRFLHRRYPPHLVGQQPYYPLLEVRLGQRPHVGEVLKCFLNQMQCVYNGRTHEDMLENLLDAMDSCQTRGIIINEANHIVSSARGGARVGARLLGEFGDWLKKFVDDIRRPVFLYGIPGWEDEFYREKQLGSRVPLRYTIQLFQFDAVFIGALKALDEAIPMPQPAGLSEPDMARKLFTASRTTWRHLIHLLRDAILSASKRGASRIEEHDLHWAYNLQFGPDANPFSAR